MPNAPFCGLKREGKSFFFFFEFMLFKLEYNFNFDNNILVKNSNLVFFASLIALMHIFSNMNVERII